MKTIHVAAAIIEKDGMIFATQRGYGDYKEMNNTLTCSAHLLE